MAIIGYAFILRGSKNNYKTEIAVRGSVVRNVSETGSIDVSEKVNIGFKNSGRIAGLAVRVGDSVEAGQEIGRLDTKELNIKVAEAQASLNGALADYNKLMVGYSSQEIAVVQTQVQNAQVSLDNAKQSLLDTQLQTQDDLNDSYSNAQNYLEDAKLKAYNAYVFADGIYRSYFILPDQAGFAVSLSLNNIKSASDKINQGYDDFDKALIAAKEALLTIKSNLETIRNMEESEVYKSSVSSADKTSTDNQKSYIVTALSNISDSQQAISTVKVENGKALNLAKAEVASAEANLNILNNQLILKQTGPTQENINLYQAKVDQARANLFLLQNDLGEAVLRSPFKGQIVELNKRAGEIVQPIDYVVSILPAGPFEVKADIYEEDVVNIQKDNPVQISIPAFPDQIFNGRVISIDPSEKLIDGVVYYEVTIGFDETIEGIKPGMTADVAIETGRKENVLIVPRGGVKKKNGQNTVLVLEKGKLVEKNVKIGLVGEDSVEILSGLEEGAKIVIE